MRLSSGIVRGRMHLQHLVLVQRRALIEVACGQNLSDFGYRAGRELNVLATLWERVPQCVSSQLCTQEQIRVVLQQESSSRMRTRLQGYLTLTNLYTRTCDREVRTLRFYKSNLKFG